MITLASLLGLMMVGTTVDFSGAIAGSRDDGDDDLPEGEDDGFRDEMPAFGFEDLLSGAVATDVFGDPGEDGLARYLEDEAAIDALADEMDAAHDDDDDAADDRAVGSSLAEWLAMAGDAPSLIEDYDEAEDALFVIYDDVAHPDPVLSMARSDTGEDDGMLMLDGLPLAVVSGGASIDIGTISLVPESQMPAALAAAC